MYIKVYEENQIQLDTFNRIWIECWNEKGFELEFTPQSDKYIILDENETPIGTTEFIPYGMNNNACENLFGFFCFLLIYRDNSPFQKFNKVLGFD
jgi:hypothetical protein